MPMIPLILTLERFPILLPGFYGNTTYATPGMDALSLTGTVFDRVYATHCDPLQTLEQIWSQWKPSTTSVSFLSDREIPHLPSFFTSRQTCDAEDFFSRDFSNLETEKSLFWVHFQHWNWQKLDAWLVGKEILALLSVSGLPAEKELEEDALPMLHHTEIQLPWWIRFPHEKYRALHIPHLLTPADFGTLWENASPDAIRRTEVLTQSPPRWSLVTDEWFLTAMDDLVELYSKPNDWWEQNDVADRCPDVVENLANSLP
ncbi:MAG: hypothetical protein Q4D62_04995 [Planctomycetia bacterium]|nr:hypothetical protein [Planctomycetia bacterium]